MNHRAVAAGTGHQIALEPFARAGHGVRLDVDRGHTGSGHVLAATGFNHCAAGQDADALGPGFFHQRTAWVAAGIGDGHHLQAGIKPIQGHAVGVIVVGAQDQLLARRDAVATHVGGDRTSQHVARYVVVAVDQRPLARAGRQDHALGANPVDALAHLADRSAVAEVVGEALVNGQEVMVVVTVDRGTWQQQHVRGVLEFGDNAGDPFGGRLAVEAFTGVEQAAAELFLFISEDHPRPAACSRQCRGQASRAGADDQHVAVLVHVVVSVRIVFGRRATQASGLADVLRTSSRTIAGT